MTYKLHGEAAQGRVVGLSLGVAEVDAYLDFLKHRCRPNTRISCGDVDGLPYSCPLRLKGASKETHMEEGIRPFIKAYGA